MVRNIALGILAILALVIGGAWLLQGASTPTLTALGGRWQAQNLTWAQLGDAWRISAEMHPRKVSLSNANAGDLLHSLCGAMLTGLPGKPAEGITREQVYRLDLNVTLPEGANRSALFDRQIPLPVNAGRCGEIAGDTEFFPTYPAPLDKWFVATQQVWTSGEASVREVVFAAKAGQPAGLDAFPLEFACEAVLGDPLVSAEALMSALPEERLAALDRGLLRITVQQGVGVGPLRAGLYRAETFQVADGACTPAPQAAE